MSTSKSVMVINAVSTALSEITENNGYHTDLGNNIHRGFLAHAIQADNKACPFLVIQPNSEGLATPGTLQGRVKLALTLFVVDKADEPERLQSAVSDLRRALVRYEELPRIDRATIGVNEYSPAAYNPQPDSNFALAALPVSFSFMETYED